MKLFSKKPKLPKPVINGQKLVADFQNAVVNLTTMSAAQAEAERSEQDVTQAIQYVSGGGQNYVTPSNITPDFQQLLVKNSMDAHLKKVQAAQISSFTVQQVTQMQLEAEKNYIGKKVRVVVEPGATDALLSIWADKNTGQLTDSKYKGTQVTGRISELSLENNALMIVPAWHSRLLFPGRKYFLIRVINLDTMEPAVSLQLI